MENLAIVISTSVVTAVGLGVWFSAYHGVLMQRYRDSRKRFVIEDRVTGHVSVVGRRDLKLLQKYTKKVRVLGEG